MSCPSNLPTSPEVQSASTCPAPGKALSALPPYLGRAYRSGPVSSLRDVPNAAEVVRYETEELGNTLYGFDPSLYPELEGYPATALVWVCRTKTAARRYGMDIREIPIVPGAVIVGEDRDDVPGFLVLNAAVRKEG